MCEFQVENDVQDSLWQVHYYIASIRVAQAPVTTICILDLSETDIQLI